MSANQKSSSPLRASSYAALNNLCPRKVYRWLNNGKLKGHKIDGVWFV